MGLVAKKNVLLVEESDLDIYIAGDLKKILIDMLDKGSKKVTIDMKQVERVTTPALQVILGARKSFAELKLKSLGDSLKEELKKMGIEP